MAASNLNLGKASGGILNVSPADGTTNTSLVLPAINGTVVAADSNGNVGIGVTPSAWQSGITALNLGNSFIHYGGGTNFVMGVNAYANVGYKYKSTGYASNYTQQDGAHYWYTAPSGTAGNAITWTNAMTLDSSGNLLVVAGGLGYGTGAGGTVTQLTSKSTAVTLNKPTGAITMNNAALSANTGIAFPLNNSLLSVGDLIIINHTNANGVNVLNYNTWCTISASGQAFIMLKNISTGSLSESVEIRFTIIKGVSA